MGTNIAADIVAENHVCNEQKLWRHVILNAIARSKDFEQICWWAGWEPDNVRYRYYKALKSGDIKFKRRHFLWHQYDLLFQRLKVEKDLDKRRELRRNVENKRRQIMLADNVYVDHFKKDLGIEI